MHGLACDMHVGSMVTGLACMAISVVYLDSLLNSESIDKLFNMHVVCILDTWHYAWVTHSAMHGWHVAPCWTSVPHVFTSVPHAFTLVHFSSACTHFNSLEFSSVHFMSVQFSWVLAWAQFNLIQFRSYYSSLVERTQERHMVVFFFTPPNSTSLHFYVRAWLEEWVNAWEGVASSRSIK